MKLDDITVKHWLIKDADYAGDYEAAHALEDEMLWDFVKEVAQGTARMRQLEEMAITILNGRDDNAKRVCA